MYDNLKDRGTIKWNSIMLPEHVEALKKVFVEDERKEKPILDEQQIIEMDATLKCALKDDLTIKVKYYKDYEYHMIKGKLLTADMLHGYIRLDDDHMTEIEFSEIVDVSML